MCLGLELTLTPISLLQKPERWGKCMQLKVKVTASNPLFQSQCIHANDHSSYSSVISVVSSGQSACQIV